MYKRQVFENEVNELSRPALYYVETVKEEPIPIDKLLEKVAATLPDSEMCISDREAGVTGQLYVNNHRKNLSDKYTNHVQKEQLWEVTERSLAQWLT